MTHYSRDSGLGRTAKREKKTERAPIPASGREQVTPGREQNGERGEVNFAAEHHGPQERDGARRVKRVQERERSEPQAAALKG